MTEALDAPAASILWTASPKGVPSATASGTSRMKSLTSLLKMVVRVSIGDLTAWLFYSLDKSFNFM